jgi:predicted MFS family arabinose efflux permease
MALLWVGSFTAAAGPIGVGVLVGLYLRDELDVSSSLAGVALLLGGLTAMAFGPTWGRLLDAWGAVRACAFSTVGAIVLTAPIGLIARVPMTTLAWMAASAFVGFVVINIQNLAATAVPDNRGGALSSVLAFRFIGHAVGPLMWVPVFETSAAWAFAGAAALGLVTFASLVAAAVRGASPHARLAG